jgi:FtsZ-interacting cell division protein ZipA
MDLNLVLFIINILLIIIFAIVGFWLKSLYKEVKTNQKELALAKETFEHKFTFKEVCDEKHNNIGEKLDSMESSMKSNFIRLYDKVDAGSSIGDGLKELGQAIKESNK